MPEEIVMPVEIAQFAELYQQVVEFIVEYSFQLLGALLVLIIGIIIAGRAAKFVTKICERRNVDVTLTGFVANVVRLLVIAMVLVVVLEKVGISIGPFLAAIGALSLGAGLAVQGLLTNYSAGLSIIITRPFVVGDTITIVGVTGIVKEVKLAYTILVDEDDVEITVPNKHVIGEIIANSHTEKLIELSIGIAYAENPKAAIDLIVAAVSNIDGVSTERPPVVGIESFGDSSVNITARFWGATDRFYELSYEANLAIFNALQNADIEIPFPQREVLVKKQLEVA